MSTPKDDKSLHKKLIAYLVYVAIVLLAFAYFFQPLGCSHFGEKNMNESNTKHEKILLDHADIHFGYKFKDDDISFYVFRGEQPADVILFKKEELERASRDGRLTFSELVQIALNIDKDEFKRVLESLNYRNENLEDGNMILFWLMLYNLNKGERNK